MFTKCFLFVRVCTGNCDIEAECKRASIRSRPPAGIVTGPAVMESTTHLLAHGVDLMYARFAPASFDGLASDFPHALLVLLVAIMAAGSFVLRTLAQKRDVKCKWE